ncbi:MAG TPA: nicotinate (nicotinamide) nucleotide adenylyltransferase [Acidimicrobiales bacterium]|nr:nicotinate (nicotinamide) nucleotide adenylyltransferase [Acidimicrobiales bacterium]
MPAPDRPERIGIFGGTFDPPHRGHDAAARAVVRALDLDRLLLVVANDPWQKSPTRELTPAAERLAMTGALAQTIPRAEASAMEIDRGGPSYTVDTVEALATEAARAHRAPPELFVVVGEDLVSQLDSWERVEDLRQEVTLVVVSRPGSTSWADPPGWRTRRVVGPQVDVSSSDLRQALARGASVADLVPERVIRCIGRRGLYAVSR